MNLGEARQQLVKQLSQAVPFTQRPVFEARIDGALKAYEAVLLRTAGVVVKESP